MMDDDDDDDGDDDDHLLRLDAFLHLLKEVCPRQSNHGRRLMPTFQYQNINVFFLANQEYLTIAL